MLDFFEWLVDFFQSIGEFVTNLFNSFVTAIGILSQASSFPLQLVKFVPGIIGSCIIMVTAVAVIKLVLGWGNK